MESGRPLFRASLAMASPLEDAHHVVVGGEEHEREQQGNADAHGLADKLLAHRPDVMTEDGTVLVARLERLKLVLVEVMEQLARGIRELAVDLARAINLLSVRAFPT